jgi:uncharacterized protein (DUF1778 family)
MYSSEGLETALLTGSASEGQRGGTDMNTATAMAAPEFRESRRRDTVINVRLSRMLRDLIDRAADVLGKTRTEFILESARTHAIDVLLDQRLFTLHAEQYEAFIRTLEAPPVPNEKLKQLLASKSPWEK